MWLSRCIQSVAGWISWWLYDHWPIYIEPHSIWLFIFIVPYLALNQSSPSGTHVAGCLDRQAFHDGLHNFMSFMWRPFLHIRSFNWRPLRPLWRENASTHWFYPSAPSSSLLLEAATAVAGFQHRALRQDVRQFEYKFRHMRNLVDLWTWIDHLRSVAASVSWQGDCLLGESYRVEEGKLIAETVLTQMSWSIDALISWMATNCLLLNPSKTQVIRLSGRRQLVNIDILRLSSLFPHITFSTCVQRRRYPQSQWCIFPLFHIHPISEHLLRVNKKCAQLPLLTIFSCIYPPYGSVDFLMPCLSHLF